MVLPITPEEEATLRCISIAGCGSLDIVTYYEKYYLYTRIMHLYEQLKVLNIHDLYIIFDIRFITNCLEIMCKLESIYLMNN
jgi:hypothetical protein